MSHKISLTMFDQVMVNLGLLFLHICKVIYSNEIYRPNSLMIQTKSKGHLPLGSWLPYMGMVAIIE